MRNLSSSEPLAKIGPGGDYVREVHTPRQLEDHELVGLVTVAASLVLGGLLITLWIPVYFLAGFAAGYLLFRR